MGEREREKGIGMRREDGKAEPFIAQGLDFGIGLAFDQVISLSCQPQGVLPPEEDVIRDTTAQEENHQISHDDAVSLSVLWRILDSVNVAADDTVQIPPSDDEPQGDTTLVDTFGVVGDPGDGVGDGRVDAQRAQECPGVLNTSRFGTQKHGEPDDSNQGNAYIAKPSLAGFVG